MSPQHQSAQDTFSQMPTNNWFMAILERQAQEAWEQATEQEATYQQWMINFQADSHRWEAQQQAETHKLFKELCK